METSITQDGAGRRLSSRLYVKGSLGSPWVGSCDPGRICGTVRLFYDLLLSAGFVASFRSLWGWVVGTLTRYANPYWYRIPRAGSLFWSFGLQCLDDLVPRLK